MAWVKIDDQFTEHPKLAQVGAAGIALQVAGLCYSARLLTDGFIPDVTALRLVTFDVSVEAADVIARLLDAGIWAHDEKRRGYVIHGYRDYQPTKKQVEAKRKATSDRVSKWRKKQTSNAVTNSVVNSVGTPAPVPVPHIDRSKDLSRDQGTSSFELVPLVGVVADAPTEIAVSRMADPIWDAVMAVCRIDTSSIPTGARSGYGKVVKELKRIDATAAEVLRRATAYRVAYPDAALTPYALLKHWAQVEGVATQPKVSGNELELSAWASEENS